MPIRYLWAQRAAVGARGLRGGLAAAWRTWSPQDTYHRATGALFPDGPTRPGRTAPGLVGLSGQAISRGLAPVGWCPPQRAAITDESRNDLAPPCLPERTGA